MYLLRISLLWASTYLLVSAATLSVYQDDFEYYKVGGCFHVIQKLTSKNRDKILAHKGEVVKVLKLFMSREDFREGSAPMALVSTRDGAVFNVWGDMGYFGPEKMNFSELNAEEAQQSVDLHTKSRHYAHTGGSFLILTPIFTHLNMKIASPYDLAEVLRVADKQERPNLATVALRGFTFNVTNTMGVFVKNNETGRETAKRLKTAPVTPPPSRQPGVALPQIPQITGGPAPLNPVIETKHYIGRGSPVQFLCDVTDDGLDNGTVIVKQGDIGVVKGSPGREVHSVAEVAVNGVVFDVFESDAYAVLYFGPRNRTLDIMQYTCPELTVTIDRAYETPGAGFYWLRNHTILRVTQMEKGDRMVTVMVGSAAVRLPVSEGYFVPGADVKRSAEVYKHLKVGAVFRFNDDVVNKQGLPVARRGARGVVVSVNPDHASGYPARVRVNDITIGVDETMGDFLPGPERIVTSTNSALLFHVGLFLGVLYITGVAGKFFKISFDTVAGCGMNVHQLSKPLRAWYYLCMFLSFLWKGLEFAVTMTARLLVSIYSFLKTWYEERQAR
eukprot:TRINITY_DN7115_c0_g1_i4.p2 TRINITY_DN7115_c0_g1~~TRINITY_DN7115_c0_g1_i4.p2  ORF type:complete len:558 (+),score=122.12 TRINITY_DN7115_c0_g1_i4:3109-4782(+)